MSAPIPHHDRASYRAIDITAELAARAAPPRQVDEARAILALAATLVEDTTHAMEGLASMAGALTGAQSCGVSIGDTEDGAPVFRWVAVTGALAEQRGQTLPRYFSPCGDVARTGQLLLMRQPARHYPYIGEIDVPVHEVLLSPLQQDGKVVGTVWAVAHDAGKRFDAEDARLLASVTRFVSDGCDLLSRLAFGVQPH